MGTKRNPGKFDCLDKLADDEPFFVLRAKDKFAPRLIRLWAALAIESIPAEKSDEAHQCARDMEAWAMAHGGAKDPD